MKFILDERFTLNEEDDPNLDEEDLEAEEKGPDLSAGSADGKINWAELYKACKTKEDFEHFWHGNNDPRLKLNYESEADAQAKLQLKIKVDGYFKYEWEEEAATIESYGIDFIETLDSFGWTESLNPFILFLKTRIKKKDIPLTRIKPDSFTVLYDSVSNNIISAKELKDGGKLKEYNLIFNPDFYNKSSVDQKKYLKEQHRVCSSEIPTVPATKLPTVFANIYTKTGDLSNPLKSISAGGVLRDVSAVKLAVNNLLGKEDDTVTASDKTVTAILAKISNAELAKKMIAFIVDAYSLITPEAISTANNTTKGAVLRIRDTTRPTYKETKDFLKLLGGSSTKYSKERLATLLVKLVEKTGVS
jgi:hypothetical protein